MALQFSTLSLRPGTTPAAVPPAPAPASAALGEVLLERKLITPEQLKIAIEHQRTSNRRIGQVLIDLGFTNADAVLGALSPQLGVPATRLNGFTVSASAVQALPEKIARKHLAVPLQKIGVMLQVAIACPNNLAALDDLRFATGCQIQTFVALEDEIAAAVDRFYGSAPAAMGRHEVEPPVPVQPVSIERRTPSVADRRQSAGRRLADPVLRADVFDQATEQTAVRAVDRILSNAATVGASDIHLERTPDSLRVRLRVDGTFQEI